MKIPTCSTIGIAGSIFALIFLASPASAADAPAPTAQPTSRPSNSHRQFNIDAARSDLTSISLEDLMNLEVTSVTKQRQRIADAPAAIYVITSDDIAHSGQTTIPDLLRLSPGLQVARTDAHSWAITSRGFNSTYANKLQVLMDGRTLYTPMFSGTVWANQDYILQDLDRIEVIRGPGAVLWGSNAVNGVINITTKDARDTQGWLIDGLGGNVEQQGSVRYGGQIDDLTFYRIYAKAKNTDDFEFSGGDRDAGDGWESERGGFRIDRHSSDSDHLTLQGDIYRNRVGSTANIPISSAPFMTTVSDTASNDGQNLLARWTHVISAESDFSLQLYYDRFSETQIVGTLVQQTFDLDFQHRFRLSKRQEIIWGAGLRSILSSTNDSASFHVTDGQRADYLASAFIQDAISIVPERWTLYLGSKFEMNSFSGFEVQPSARLLWTPNDRNSVWGAISRAVRTPSVADQDATIAVQSGVLPPSGIPFTIELVGNDELNSETLLAYELGYRVKLTKSLSVDVATFFNSYDSLRTNEIGAPVPGPGGLLIPLANASKGRGESYGLELAATWNVNDDWRLTASYTYFQLHLHRSGSSTDPAFEGGEGSDPHNQFQIHSQYNLTRKLTFDAALYYVDSIPTLDLSSNINIDLGLTWRPNQTMQLSAWVKNVLDSGHSEFASESLFNASEVPRSFYVEATWRF